MPSRRAITIVGRGHAYASWKSATRAGTASIASSSSSASVPIDVSSCSTVRGVNARLNNWRNAVCSGGSFTSPAGFVYCGLWP